MAKSKDEQRQKFVETAKSIGADDTASGFDRVLRKVAGAKPAKKQSKPKKPAK